MFTEDQIVAIVTAELVSLLWSEGEEYNESGEFTGKFWDEMWEDFYSADDATPELVAQLTEELTEDLEGDELEALEIYMQNFGSAWAESFGHDLALTRNGHGAGFWDRGLGEAGDVLTDWAQSLGELHMFHGHDSIYPEWEGMFHAV